MTIRKSFKAFTMTELVIVITILAILSTIAFVSYTNNVSSTRDNKRQLDIDTIKIALQEYKNQNGTYPLPGNYFNITFSGGVVAKQGELNTDVVLSTLDTIPTDPLDQHYYSYSVTADQKQYQIAATIEDDGNEKVLLEGDYQSVAKNILPNIILATNTGALTSIEISTGTTLGVENRKLFLFNQLNDNIVHSLDGSGNSISSGEVFSSLLAKSEEIDYWQKHDYISCDEISSAGKSIGPGEYQIMADDGTLVNTYCAMTTVCSPSQHLSGGVCIYNTRTCNTSNGTGTQTWHSGTNSWVPDPCIANTCDSGYFPISGSCVLVCTAGGEVPCVILNTGTPSSQACTIGHGTGNQIWNSGTASWNACIVSTCDSGYHNDSNACVSDTQSCTISNGSGNQTWNPGTASWNSCIVSSCNSGYHINSNSCISNIQSCSIANGTGNQTWNSGTSSWNSCSVVSCNSGYFQVGVTCSSTVQSCTITNGTGAQSWNSGTSSWNTCTVNSCDPGYYNDANSCADSTQTCTITNGTGTQSWDYTTLSWNTCNVDSCDPGYHNNSNSCINNTQPCPIVYGVGTHTWNGSSWSTCNVVSCDPTFYISGNSCARDCASVDGTALSQGSTTTFYNDSYGCSIPLSAQCNYGHLGSYGSVSTPGPSPWGWYSTEAQCNTPITMNGVCNNLSPNTCSSGLFFDSTEDTETHWEWSCIGTNGGTSDNNCSTPKP